MDSSLLSHPSSGSDPDPDGLQQHVGFFRKLGYSTPQVEAALRKLGLNPDINSVLEELVQTSHKRSPARSEEAPNPGPLRPAKHLSKAEDSDLRPIVIDGSNVAMSHGNKEVFSCRGIQLAVDFFLGRGHRNITVFVPTWRKEQPRPDAPISDQQVLTDLEKNKVVVFTPSRRVGGKRVVCYDDRFIVKLAFESDGVIVSNDTYRDLQGERPEWKKCIEERLLMYSFVNDKFMPPDDPLGRHGPSLDNFLRKNPLPTEQKKQPCPYDKKCTYGIKCKFFHPERVNHSYVFLADELREKAVISKAKEEEKAPHSIAETSPRIVSRQPKEERKWASVPADPGRTPQLCPVEADPQFPSHYHTNVPHEYLDSGLGSYENLYSVCDSHRVSLPHLRCTSEMDFLQPRGCSSPTSMAFNPKNHQSQSKNSNVPMNHRSLPGQYNERSGHKLHSWSDPFHGDPQVWTSSQSELRSFSGSTDGHRSWDQQPRKKKEAFDPQRLELRQNLHTIFNPRHVDAVMEMFPHVTDAEKLAAEILNMKAQGRFH